MSQGPIYLRLCEAAFAPKEIAAVAFIPLQQNRRLLGKFMAYYDTPHAFTPAEMGVALTLARQLGFGLERMHAERAAQHLAAIVESSEDAIISKDLAGVILTWNAGAERIFGYKAHEVVGQPVSILIPADRQDEEPRILARIRAGERVDHFETIRRHKDGHPIDISLSISPIRDEWGRIMGASKIARDISERKEAEAKLRESEQQLKDLLAAIPAAIYTTDAKGRITYYNDKAVELAGREPVLGSDEWCVTWKLYWPDGTPAAARSMPHGDRPQGGSRHPGCRSRGRASRRHAGSVHPLPHAAPRREGPDRRRDQHAGRYQRAQAGRDAAAASCSTSSITASRTTCRCCSPCWPMRRANTQHAEARQVLGEASDRLAAMAAAQRVLLRHHRCDPVRRAGVPERGLQDGRNMLFPTMSGSRADPMSASCPMTRQSRWP